MAILLNLHKVPHLLLQHLAEVQIGDRTLEMGIEEKTRLPIVIDRATHRALAGEWDDLCDLVANGQDFSELPELPETSVPLVDGHRPADEDALNFWSDLYVMCQLKRYVHYPLFIRNPHFHWSRIMCGDADPRLARRQQLEQELAELIPGIEVSALTLDKSLDELDAEIDQLELRLLHTTNLRRINGGTLYEPLKHHAHPRSAPRFPSPTTKEIAR